MENFENRSNKVFNFLDKVKAIKDQEVQDQEFQNSYDYKLKCLDKEEKHAKDACLNMVFTKMYKDALPLNDDYKQAHNDDLDCEMRDFIKYRCPEGAEYYVKEAIKKGSKVCKRIMESVEKLVDSAYEDRAKNLDEYNVKDLVFSSDDDMQRQINVVNKDLELDDISKIIKDSVKTSAASEILRAKKEKEDIKQLEADLANDMNIKNEEDIQEAMELRGYGQKTNFQPTLFQGIMIGNMNKYTKMEESGSLESDYIYNTLEEYGYTESSGEESASKEELAFVETVKEYTKLSIVKALKLEKFSLNDINELANEYAYNSEFIV